MGTSFRNNAAQKRDLIKNKPLVVTVTLFMIYWEVIPSMINVVPIHIWDMFNILFTVTSVAEFNDILFKARRKTFEFIQSDFSKKICIAIDENSDEVKSWKEKMKSVTWRGKVTQ